ncbi:hypothetical protein ILUMI_27509 [Ignelater luminosus]|uniref:Uncharacterized protein n=1 Tax=Ignelater luminosus TaxID=2038154 RepID=A0A8K0C355_IGNLU|nr:hypothetical protein ILUMI_27509 [Ignelater luminosus]
MKFVLSPDKGIQTPICAVSGAKFLTETGWIDLRNAADSDVPFRLFRDEGRTFLQWVGESELRTRMSGRLVLVHLLCRELTTPEQEESDVHSVFAPCVAFRVVGTPSKYLHNVSEVSFSADAHAADDMNGNGLSISEYVAIGISSILLGLIYVASVFLYLHIRKRRKDSDKEVDRRDNQSLTTAEEGVIKSNPLLGLGRHFSGIDNSYSDSGSSDTDVTPDVVQQQDDRLKSMQITSALIHPPQSFYDSNIYSSKNILESIIQDSPSIERLPEENVSIVETIEGREERPETVRAITGTTRRKLYFNPAYFEPELLLAPPPAALEFLTKIREVITIAKQKMVCKRFIPSLLGIPEEETDYSVEQTYDKTRASSSRRGSMISLKRENSRRRTCTGCPGCEPQDLKSLCGRLPEFPSLVACKSCTTNVSESKQKSIQRWLENVPILKPLNTDDLTSRDALARSLQDLGQFSKFTKRLRSPTRSLSPEHISYPFRTLSPRPASERARSPSRTESIYGGKAPSTRSQPSSKPRRLMVAENPLVTYRKSPIKPKAPPPPLPTGQKSLDRKTLPKLSNNLPPPDMIHEAMVVDNKKEEKRIPTIKKNMNAVINEFASQHGINGSKTSDSSSSPEIQTRQRIDYEADSLERSGIHKGYATPTEYGEVSSSQPSPSLSSALPMAEEMTIRNAILNAETGNLTVSRLNTQNVQSAVSPDDYELIVLKKGVLESNLYNLPEILQRNNGYSLVSEVYVNNGYNYGSAPSTPSHSNCSTLERRKAKIKYQQPEDKPGQLTIEVEDCPDNYIRVEDSDNFEPDTLDRKPSKRNMTLKSLNNNNKDEDYIDSLERPNQILLRTTGSFKNDSLVDTSDTDNSLHARLNRTFGSLREIYEFKTKNCLHKSAENLNSLGNLTKEENGLITWKNETGNKDFEGRILTLEERHSRRQRRILSQNLNHPKPPRKVIIDVEEALKPPLPPKNGNGRSTSQNNENEENVPASPISDRSYDLPPSSLSGASVSPNSSDYETCTVGEVARDKRGYDINMLKQLMHPDDVVFKNAINNQFILQASVSSSSPSLLTKMPLKSLQSLMQPHEDSNNNTYFSSGYEKRSEEIKKAWNKVINQSPNQLQRKPVDSGYLSTDSSESHKRKQTDSERETSGAGSETDESFGDGHSESGAESVETHSVFFGSYRKPCYMTNSFDSGTGSELRILDTLAMLADDCASTDSETVSYTTVVPVASERSTISSSRSSIVIEK